MTFATPLRILSLPLLLCLLLTASPAAAQVMGADDFEDPSGDTPGDASPAPPTDPDAVHGGDMAPAPEAEAETDLPDGDRQLTVRVHHASDEDARFDNHLVTLRALRRAGPLQPDSHHQVVDSWDALTDDQGVATFEDLPNDLDRRGLYLQATTDASVRGGTTSFETPLYRPTNQIDFPIYDRTDRYPGLRVAHKRVLVSPWEEYLVIDQFWTLQLEGDHYFDVTDSDDPALERGIPLRLPFSAEGISAAGPGDFDVINNIVYWRGSLQPNHPVTVQIRYSMEARQSSLTVEHPMQYSVDEIEILAPLETQFEKVPYLEDLSLSAPGFENFSTNPNDVGVHSNTDFLIAYGRSLDRDTDDLTYEFTVDGLPFGRPLGAWIALFGGLIFAVFLFFFGRREYRAFQAQKSRQEVLKALKARKESLIEELAELQQRIDGTDDPELLFDLEDRQTLLRQRLTLVMSKTEALEEESAQESSAQAA